MRRGQGRLARSELSSWNAMAVASVCQPDAASPAIGLRTAPTIQRWLWCPPWTAGLRCGASPGTQRPSVHAASSGVAAHTAPPVGGSIQNLIAISDRKIDLYSVKITLLYISHEPEQS